MFAQIEVLGRISHKNLVSLLGYCEEGTNLALVYEYMARGDLKALLNGETLYKCFSTSKLQLVLLYIGLFVGLT